jgi:hypothetical protein
MCLKEYKSSAIEKNLKKNKSRTLKSAAYSFKDLVKECKNKLIALFI